MIGPESGLSTRAHLHTEQFSHSAILQLSHRQSMATTQRISAAHHRHHPIPNLMATDVITVTPHQNNVIIQIVFLEICLHHFCSSLSEWAKKKEQGSKNEQEIPKFPKSTHNILFFGIKKISIIISLIIIITKAIKSLTVFSINIFTLGLPSFINLTIFYSN